MATPTVKVKVDWQADPSATYFDIMRSRSSVASLWRMDDTTGSVLADFFAANPGTRVNSPSSVTGPYAFETSNGLGFNGTTQYASVPFNATLLSGSYQLAGWAKVDTIPASTKCIATLGSIRIDVLSTGKLQATVINHVAGVATQTQITSTTVVTAGTWYRVSVVYDATLDLFLLYVNARLEVSASHTVGTELWGLPLLFAARHSGTLPAFGSVGAIFTAGPSDPWVIGAPANIAVDNLLIAHLFVGTSFAVAAPPAGWNLYTQSNPLAGTTHYVYYKIAVAGDVGAANYTFDMTGSAAGYAAITRFTGIDPAQPFANPPYDNLSLAGGTSFSSGSRIPLADDILLLALFGASREVGFTSTATERYDASPAGGGGVGRGLAMFTTTVGAATASQIDVTSTASLSAGQAVDSLWIALKGPDAQDFLDADLKDWSFRSLAPTADEIEFEYQGRLGGEGPLTDLAAGTASPVQALETKVGRQFERGKMENGQL